MFEPLSETAIIEVVNVLKYNSDGIIPAISQQHDTGEVLMMAWMNKESILLTLKKNKVTYFSRSRKKLWEKGETSGNYQILQQLISDCDEDTLLAIVEQKGVACHKGKRSCFTD